MSNKTVTVAFTSEENTIKSLTTAIISLLENTNTTKYDIQILYKKKYSKSNNEIIINLQKKYKRHSISFVEIEKTENNNAILVSNILKNIDKCIYLSYDVIVQKDLSELYNTDLKDNYIAGVKDENGINQNVMLVNSALIRQDKVEEISEKIMLIEPKYNLRADYFIEEKSFNFTKQIRMKSVLKTLYDMDELKGALRDNYIFSYTDEVNPLNDKKVSFSEVWLKYYKLSPFENIDTPLISVIVPVYNVEKYLELCVDSILNQSYKNLQIILVDDGSTDNSGQMCYDLAKKDNRICVIHKPNAGLSSARNFGMGIADGDYISFIDSDDFIHPNTYNIAINIFKNNSDLDLVEWEFENVAESSQKYYNIKFNSADSKDIEIHDSNEYLIANINYSKHYHVVWNKLYKSELIKNSRFIVGKCNEDVFFSNEYMFKVKKAGYLPNKLHYYMQRKESIIHQKISMKNVDGAEGLYERHKIIVKDCPELIERDLMYALSYTLRKIQVITKQNYDKDKSIRIAFMNILLKYYDYVMQFDSIPQNIKDDFILAKKDVVGFIEKYEIDKNKINISVIIPVYNVEKYIKQSLDSVINQTLKNIEIICIDDGSTDNSLAILKEYAKNDKRIIIIEQQNRGAGAARNRGLDIAKGEFLSILDPDDFFDCKMLEKSYNSAVGNDSDIVIFDINLYNDEKNQLFKPNTYPIKENIVFSYKDLPDQIFINFRSEAWNKLFRTSFIKDNDIRFQEIYRSNDIYFTNVALVTAKKITKINQRLVNYRIGLKNNSQSTLHKYPLTFYDAELAIKKRINKIGVYKDVEKGFLIALLSVSFYCLNQTKDLEAIKIIYNHLKDNLDKDFGITKHPKEYYSSQFYDFFMLIQNNTFDDYIKTKRRSI